MKVNYFENRADMEVALMGALGFGTDYIAARTGLTHCQVLYRLGKAKICRVEYRNGDSQLARQVFGSVKGIAESSIRGKLRTAMKDELSHPSPVKKRA